MFSLVMADMEYFYRSRPWDIAWSGPNGSSTSVTDGLVTCISS